MRRQHMCLFAAVGLQHATLERQGRMAGKEELRRIIRKGQGRRDPNWEQQVDKMCRQGTACRWPMREGQAESDPGGVTESREATAGGTEEG